MNSFTKQFVCNISKKHFPDKTLSSFTKFLPEQLNLEGLWDVAVPELSYPSMYWKFSKEKFMFFCTNLSNSSEFYYLELDSTIQLPIFWKLWTRLFKKNTISEKFPSQWKCLEERKKLRFTSQTQDRVLYSSARSSDPFSEVMLEMNLE